MLDCQVRCVVRSDFSPPHLPPVDFSLGSHSQNQAGRGLLPGSFCTSLLTTDSVAGAEGGEGQRGLPHSFCIMLLTKVKQRVMCRVANTNTLVFPCLQPLLSSWTLLLCSTLFICSALRKAVGVVKS